MSVLLHLWAAIIVVAESNSQERHESQPHQEKIAVDAVQSARLSALSEDGYQAVAKLRNDEAMKMYMRRVLKIFGRQVADEGALSGFVPHYSGVIAVQNYDKLKDELLASPWTSLLGARKRADATTGMIFTSVDLASTTESPRQSGLDTTSSSRKALFTKVLSTLQSRSDTAKEYNSVIFDDINKLKKETRALIKSAEWLQSSNDMMYNTLRNVDPEVQVAQKFLAGSLQQKDFRESPELQFLTETIAPRPILASLLARARAVTKQSDVSQVPRRSVSLLALNAPEEEPSKLTSRLMHGEPDLAKLEATYDIEMSLLLQERSDLRAKRKEMLYLRDDLKSEEDVLKNAHAELQSRALGMGSVGEAEGPLHDFDFMGDAW